MATASSLRSFPPERGVRPRRPRTRLGLGLGLLAPALLLLGIFLLIPVGYAIWFSFTNLSLVGPTAIHYSFTGLQNVVALLRDSVFWQSSVITVVFVIGSGVIGVTTVALVLAMLMQSSVAAVRGVVGSIVLVSWMLPPVTAAIMWYAFSIQGGTLADVLGKPQFNGLTSAPLLMVCLANVWSTTGFSMLVISAGLQSLSTDVIEAAKLERASAWYRLTRITLPRLRPVLTTNVILVGLLSMANFTIVWIMTQGGPNDATNILPVYAYQQAFQYQHLAYGSLIGLALVIVASIVAIPFARLSARGAG